jgi:YegS/Rv2252/BmrU family lipid kinase
LGELIHVILNPNSGGGAGRRMRPEIERELARRDIAFTIEETRGPGHATELARAAAEQGIGTVVAAGGDGTIHEVVNGLLAVDRNLTAGSTALGVVPIGTGNDFVKVVAGGTDRQKAYDVLAKGRVRRFDVGRVVWEGGAEYFINGVGTGIDVEVVRQITRLPRLPGVVSYLVALMRVLARFDPIPLRIHLDDEVVERKVMIIAVGNGRCLGGGFYVCPDAAPDDGRLDVCVVKDLSMLQIARVVPRILRGTHGRHPAVHMATASSIEVVALGDAPICFQIDGELREPEGIRRLRIELERAALPVVAQESSTVVPSGRVEEAGAIAVAPGNRP